MPIAFLNRARGTDATSFYDFVTGALPTGVSFTRASSGWRYNSAGLLVSETTDAPRFQYDPAALTPRGLLIEDAATNIPTYSEQFDNAAWSKTRSSITANAIVAPDGTTTMDKLVEDTSSGTHILTRNYSFAAGTTYTQQIFAKAGERQYFVINFVSNVFGGVGTQTAVFNLGAGTVHSVTSLVTAHIQNVGSGIYRCTASCLATSSNSQPLTLALSTDGTVTSYTGDGTSGLYVWGYQMTATDFASSYIPTTSAAVARAAEMALITNPLALADQCWIVKGRTPRKIAGGATNVAMQADDGSGNNRRSLHYGTDGKLHVIATVGGVDQCDLDLGAVANDTDFAVAIRWADNNFAASLNGGAIVTDVSGSNPLGFTTARVGCGTAGNYWNSTIRTIETRRTASDAELPLLAA